MDAFDELSFAGIPARHAGCASEDGLGQFRKIVGVLARIDHPKVPAVLLKLKAVSGAKINLDGQPRKTVELREGIGK